MELHKIFVQKNKTYFAKHFRDFISQNKSCNGVCFFFQNLLYIFCILQEGVSQWKAEELVAHISTIIKTANSKFNAKYIVPFN